MEECWLHGLNNDDHRFVMVKPPGPLLKAHLQSLWPRNLPGFTPQKKRISCKPILQYGFRTHDHCSPQCKRTCKAGSLGSKRFQKYTWFETNLNQQLQSVTFFLHLICMVYSVCNFKKDSRKFWDFNRICYILLYHSIFSILHCS